MSSPAPPHPGAILLVENHERTITMLTELLTRSFPAWRVHVARGAQEAMHGVPRVDPALILMDIGLPDGNGVDLTRRILATGCRARIVVHSAYDHQVFQDASQAAGASAFVSKKRGAGGLIPVLERFLS